MCIEVYDLSDGGSIYFSIVIDDEIYLNGLNRVLGSGAARLIGDDDSIVSIAHAINNTLRLTYNYTSADFIIEDDYDMSDEDNIKRDKIVEVFNNRKTKNKTTEESK